MPMIPFPLARISLITTYDRIRIGIHHCADGIDADQVDFDPGRIGGGAQSFDGMARTAVSSDDPLFFGFGENVHHAFVTIGPVGLREAVH